MKAMLAAAACGFLIVIGGVLQAEEISGDYPFRPVPFTAVRAADGFWLPRMETNRVVSIPHAFDKCEETGRIDNFKIAGGLMEGRHRGDFPFDDTDAYKVIEGASYALMVHPDPEREQYLDALIGVIAAAQEEDGYLYTSRTNRAEHLRNWFGEERWEKLGSSHELYNSGHLFEAAVAHTRATGKRGLLEVAIKNADMLVRTFGPDGVQRPPGHQVVEMGLVQLYRETGERAYLDLARFFLDMRGRRRGGRQLYGTYSQDHRPVVEQEEAVGHAVRAAYMYAGMADVAALTGDVAYIRAIDRIWDNVVGKKLYVTGGIGARGAGEAFGENYELPNMTAYAETCAAIGNVYWNHRLFLLHGDARYIDVLERTLYNGLISGVSLDGQRFFYPNPLESQGQHRRSPWFGCACCPGNVTRFMASVPGYAYATGDQAIYVNLYLASEAELELAEQTVRVVQDTRYPWDGRIRMTVEPEQTGTPFGLHVRIPGWARDEPVPSDLYRYLDAGEAEPELRLNDALVDWDLQAGYAVIHRNWQAGDVVELNLPMPVRRVVAHAAVEDAAGKVALERGPLVYCIEWPDVPEGQVLNLVVPDTAVLASEFQSDLLGGIQLLRGEADAVSVDESGSRVVESGRSWLAIPYYAWAHRGRGEMAVWLARTPEAARARQAPTLASQAQPSASFGDPRGLNDQSEPRRSSDKSGGFQHFWPRRGTLEWVQYDFGNRFQDPLEVSAVEVYWLDDTGSGECRIPARWRILYREQDQWKPVTGASEYGLEKDRFNRTTFDPVLTDALRLEVQLPANYSAGILEWKVE